MKKGTRQLIIAAIVLAVVVLGANYIGIITIPGLPQQRLQANQGPTGGQPTSWTQQQLDDYKRGIGTFDASQTGYNSLAPATALTHGTNYNVFWYTKRAGVWTYFGTGGTTASPTVLELTSEDAGSLYVAVETVDQSTDYYIDVAKIKATNPRIKQTLFTDIDDDTVKEFVFVLDTKELSIPSSGNPDITFKGHFLVYDSSFTGLCNAADQASCTNSTVTKWNYWYLSFAAEAKAVALSKIELQFNSVDESRFALKSMTVPGVGTLDGSNFDYEETDSVAKYTYVYGKTIDQAYMLTLATGGSNQFKMDTKIEVTLTDGTHITATLYVYYILPNTTSTLSSTNDAVIFSD